MLRLNGCHSAAHPPRNLPTLRCPYNTFACVQMEFAGGKLKLSALEGAKVGPPWSKRQNALHFKEANGVSLYYEPHANHNLEDVRRVAPVDVCIVPTTSSYAAGGYPITL